MRSMQIKSSFSSGSNWRWSRLIMGIGAVFVLFAVLWTTGPASDSEQPGVRPSARVHQAVSNVMHEAKVRVQGGIGAILSVNRTNAFPLVQGVVSNSPA